MQFFHMLIGLSPWVMFFQHLCAPAIFPYIFMVANKLNDFKNFLASCLTTSQTYNGIELLLLVT